MSPIAELTKGTWHNLLPQLGIDVKYLKNKHGPCPICGGVDRFRWDNKWNMGGFICTQCGAGNGFDLVMKATGRTFKEIAIQITNILGPSKVTTKDNDSFYKALNMMKSVWAKSTAPTEGGPVSSYLLRRIGCDWKSNFMRENLDLWCQGQSNIAMLWKVISHSDQAVNIHKTYLTSDGHKSSLERPKKVMHGTLPDGCAIRTAPAKPIMGVAEGIETALSASLMYDMPVWACMNANMLSKWIPPEIAEEIHVFADNDSNYTGQAKAYALANRLEVQYKRRVIVYTPSEPDTDWNDVHRDVMKTDGSFLRLVK